MGQNGSRGLLVSTALVVSRAGYRSIQPNLFPATHGLIFLIRLFCPDYAPQYAAPSEYKISLALGRVSDRLGLIDATSGG